ncbi:sulfonate transport system ATP-binding protein [Phyllobacterium sp. 1468]|uniref:ABC transporter ATP-binding protein n=1 Tax=Phyllobacterium sp. 1468 TaxID=2817759 RepID=UPI0028582E7B|nr:ABC transporter ATP-binding protein [Phyllobacterium sp. 1468]MDR6635457.1 sulfonate transport system ATP-binding protein [Phyllobacterium sp. 1468]
MNLATKSSGWEARPVAVEARGLTRKFSGKTILDNISIAIAEGEFVALIGRSGSGKSTLLRAFADLDDDAEKDGQLWLPESSSVLFQDSRLLPWENVIRNVQLGLHLPPTELRQKARKALADVGLSECEQAWPNTLSGGEMQRAALARSLVREPKLLLADEPFGALDALTRIKMQELLQSLVKAHKPTVLLVTHDVDEALVLADRVLVMEDGRISHERYVDLPYPRRQSDARFEQLRAELLAALGVSSPTINFTPPEIDP